MEPAPCLEAHSLSAYKTCFLIKLIVSVAPGDPQPSPHYAAVGSGCFVPHIRHINDGFVVKRNKTELN